MANTVDKVIEIAKAEDGYLEKSAAAYKKDPSVLDKKEEGAGKDNYTKYGRDMHKIYPSVMDFPAAWCDCFVDWCFQKAYGVSNAKGLLAGNFNDYTVASAQLYKNKKAYYTKDPKVGDQIFFRNKSGICHTGLVIEVTDKIVKTIEGNTSSKAGVVANGGCVRIKSYPINSTNIDGYGRPKYDVAKTKKADSGSKAAEKAENQSVKTKTEKKVYKAAEPAAAYHETLSGKYVTTANLNLRDGAGTTKQLIVTLPKGQAVTCYGYYSMAQGVRWLYVVAEMNGMECIGFCSSRYLKK